MWDSLTPDVVAELTDERFAKRKHFTRATYAKGCRGPLCRKAERDRGRDRSRELAERAGREYLEYPRRKALLVEDLYLEEVIEWYFAEREKEKEELQESVA